MPDPLLLDLLEAGTRRLVRTVDAMDDDDHAGPSLLPGWTRGHVVAHLTLNAEALAGVLAGVAEGRPVSMYASDEVRDRAITELAGLGRGVLRDRFLASTTLVDQAVAGLRPEDQDTAVERTPGGRRFQAGEVPLMRLQEVEIHHSDLGLGHTAADWPVEMVSRMLGRRAALHTGPPFAVHAVDLDRTWEFGPVREEGGPTVSGPAAALAWWVTGRGTGDGLTSDDGRVPRTEPW